MKMYFSAAAGHPSSSFWQQAETHGQLSTAVGSSWKDNKLTPADCSKGALHSVYSGERQQENVCDIQRCSGTLDVLIGGKYGEMLPAILARLSYSAEIEKA